MTNSAIEAEYWAHHYADNPNVIEDVDDDFKAEDVIAAMEAGEDWETL